MYVSQMMKRPHDYLLFITWLDLLFRDSIFKFVQLSFLQFLNGCRPFCRDLIMLAAILAALLRKNSCVVVARTFAPWDESFGFGRIRSLTTSNMYMAKVWGQTTIDICNFTGTILLLSTSLCVPPWSTE